MKAKFKVTHWYQQLGFVTNEIQHDIKNLSCIIFPEYRRRYLEQPLANVKVGRNFIYFFRFHILTTLLILLKDMFHCHHRHRHHRF